MGITQLNLDGKTKVEVAVMRLQEFELPEGYWLAFSGGKDSIVIYDLALKAGINFEAHYAQTGIDPPELVQFIREEYPACIRDKPAQSMFRLIESKGFPRRQSRYCCEKLKEVHGRGHRLVTGIRWQESWRRKLRQMFEVCNRDKLTTFLHPIIDWSSTEVWEYIRTNELLYCSLYDEGFKRLGCVMCPFASAERTRIEMERWPKIAGAWYRAGKRMYDRRVANNAESVKDWPTYDDMWNWWISRTEKAKTDDCAMFI